MSILLKSLICQNILNTIVVKNAIIPVFFIVGIMLYFMLTLLLPQIGAVIMFVVYFLDRLSPSSQELMGFSIRGISPLNIVFALSLFALLTNIFSAKKNFAKNPLNIPIAVFFSVFILAIVFRGYTRTHQYDPTNLTERLKWAKDVSFMPLIFFYMSNINISKKWVKKFFILFISFCISASIEGILIFPHLESFGIYSQRLQMDVVFLERFIIYLIFAINMLISLFFLKRNKNFWIICSLLVTPFFIYVITLGGYRIALVILLVTISVTILIIRKAKGIFWIYAFFVIIALTTLHSVVQERLLSTVDLSYGYSFDSSTSHKLDVVWPIAIEMIQNNWLWGVGPDGYFHLINQCVHNAFLQSWAELGIIGFIIFIWFLYKILKFLFNTYETQQDTLIKAIAIGSFSALIGTIIFFMSIADFVTPWLFFLMFFLGILANPGIHEKVGVNQS